MKTAEEILDSKFKEGFFSEFERQIALEAMEEYASQFHPVAEKK